MQALKNIEQLILSIIKKALKVPVVKINRQQFLKKELKNRFSQDVVQLAIDKNPAYAGIGRDCINEIANNCIKYETNKVATISFVAGIPGGLAMIGTVPADITQFFAFMLRIMQKLAYLYGFEDFVLKEDEISDETLNHVLVYLGVMFGVSGTETILRQMAEVMALNFSKKIARAHLSEFAIYEIVKSIAIKLFGRGTMNKNIFAKIISKSIPVISGVISGGLSYYSFKKYSNNLKKQLEGLPISYPNFYEH